jgi:hypothetical protein
MTAHNYETRYDPPQYGKDTEPEEAARYTEQMKQILRLMLDGAWRSKKEIRVALGFDEDVAVDSRLRDLRKSQYGALEVTCQKQGKVYRYKLREKGE